MSELNNTQAAMLETARLRLCESCAWFKADDAGQSAASEPWTRGTCWRFPPALVAGVHGFEAVRPPVMASDACGEWRAGGEADLQARAGVDHAAMIRGLTDRLSTQDAGED